MELLQRHPRHDTAHAALLSDVLDVLAGSSLQPPSNEPVPLGEPLSESELRVLGYLPSNLSAPEIAAELFVSTSTVKTHMRQIYAKFDVHKRTTPFSARGTRGLPWSFEALRYAVRKMSPRCSSDPFDARSYDQR